MFTPNGLKTNGYLVVGATGCGKSTWLATLCKKSKCNVIVYKHLATIDDNAFDFLKLENIKNFKIQPGIYKKCKMGGYNHHQYIEFLEFVKKNYRNGILIIDDATIFERDRLSVEMNFLLTMKRHLGLDIFLVYHGLTLLPIEQFLLCKQIILFNTTDSLKYKASRLPKYEALVKGINLARANFRNQNIKIKYSPIIVNLE